MVNGIVSLIYLSVFSFLCPPPGNLPDPGIEPVSPTSPALIEGSLPLGPPGYQ